MWWYWQGNDTDPDTVAFMKANYKPGMTYQDFGKDFTAELFNASIFREIVEASGARSFSFD